MTSVSHAVIVSGSNFSAVVLFMMTVWSWSVAETIRAWSRRPQIQLNITNFANADSILLGALSLSLLLSWSIL